VNSGALRERAFRQLFAGQAISRLGDRLVPVALAFAVLDLTGSVTDLGFVFAAQSIPLVGFVLLGGVWGDRLPRQRVMLASDGVRAAAQGVSALLLLNGHAQIWEIAALQAVYGTAEAFFQPAATSVVPQTVAPENLQHANALLGLSSNLTAVLGPALAGVLVATVGAGWGLAADAATFVVSAAGLSVMSVKPVAVAARSSTLAELRAGWRAFRSHAWLWVTVLYFTLFSAFVFSPLQVLGPKIAKVSLGGPAAWAAISTALGLGAFLGGLAGMRWRPRYPLRVSFIAFLIGGPALYGLLAAHAPLPLILVAALIDGSSQTVFTVFWSTAIQREIPAEEQSRVSSWDFLGSLALEPVGLAICGPVAAVIGLSTTLYAAGGLFGVLVLTALAVPAVRNFTDSSRPAHVPPQARPDRAPAIR
jgi:predicted MFS family arabinose efflux permease